MVLHTYFQLLYKTTKNSFKLNIFEAIEVISLIEQDFIIHHAHLDGMFGSIAPEFFLKVGLTYFHQKYLIYSFESVLQSFIGKLGVDEMQVVIGFIQFYQNLQYFLNEQVVELVDLLGSECLLVLLHQFMAATLFKVLTGFRVIFYYSIKNCLVGMQFYIFYKFYQENNIFVNIYSIFYFNHISRK